MTNHGTLIAMSGGVDSSAAAYLTVKNGHTCAGAMMRLHDSGQEDTAREDALKIARKLDIPFYTLDLSESFISRVIDPFTRSYCEGKTPNPCIECNKHLKFGELLRFAKKLGLGRIATGHYAKAEQSGDRFLLKKAADKHKDQSYVLYTLTQEQLSRALFPLGGLTKQQVREIALSEGFTNAQKTESQDICFIPDGDYAAFILRRTGKPPQKGRFIEDETGRDLGENGGILRYTIGQRRGLGLAMPYPAYVLSLCPRDNSVVVGRNEKLFSTTFYARNINLIAADCLSGPVRACVKIRYAHSERPATVEQTGPDTLRVEFDEPQRAITPGQSAVIYDGDTVIGGGVISEAANCYFDGDLRCFR